MLAQIRPNRLEVSDRFPMLGFTIRADRSPARAEVAVATHPSLFLAEMKPKRTSANFYCSRARGPMGISRGEAVYLLPPEVLARFVGQDRLYAALAVSPDGNGAAMEVAVQPTEGSPYVSLKGLSGRGLGRVRVLPRRGSRGTTYGNGETGALDWAGDDAKPGLERAGNGANGQAPVPANGRGARAPDAANPGAAAPSPEYDDGFGPLEPAGGKPVARQVPAGEPVSAASGRSVARTLDLSGLAVARDRQRALPPSVTRLSGVQALAVEAALATLAGPLAPVLLATRTAARVTGVSIGVGPSVGAGFGVGAGLGAGIIFGPDGGIGLYGAAEFQVGFLASASLTAQVTIVDGGIEEFNGWGLAATVSGGEGLVGGASALFDLEGNFHGVSFQLGAGVGLTPVDFYIAVQRQVATSVAQAQARAMILRAVPKSRQGAPGTVRTASAALGAGGRDVDLKLRIFIPSPVIAGPIGVFGGDGRRFSYDAGTSRGEIHARVHLTPGGGIESIGVIDRHWGESTEYAEEDAVSVAGKPDWWRDRREGAQPTRRETLAVTDDNLKIYVGAPGTRRSIQSTIENASIVTMEAAGALPLAMTAPDIDADITVMLRVAGNQVQAKVIANHDGFPAYEVYANGERLYGYDPVAAGNDPTALFPPMDIETQTDWVALPSAAPVKGQALARQRAGAFANESHDEDAAHGIETPIPDVANAPGEPLGWSQGVNVEPEYPQASRFVAADSGNFRHATSPRAIDRVVIHITDGGANINGPISWFRNPKAGVSAHYIVGQDGEVVQMVRHNDVAWHARSANRDSIGIEHCANTRGLNPTETQYAASAALVRWLCDTLGIAIDREHILGHAEADTATTHTGCPNAVWDWEYFMDMVRNAYSREREPAQGQGRARGRTLGGQSFTLNWDDVEPVAQPTDVSCWAAAGAMVYGWKNRISLSPDSLAEICGRTTATGLDPAQVEQFANEMGLTFEYPMSYTIDGFRTLLENNGPLWVGASVPGLHAIVVTGFYHDGTNTYVRVTDPWDRAVGTPGAPGAYLNTHATGSRYILTWEDFVREYEAAATDFSSVNLQILHAGGTDGRVPNYGKPAGYAQSLKAARGRDLARGRTLGGQSFTLNWDDVEPVAQPTNVSCWAAAGAMVYGWKNRISLSPASLAEICGRTTATGLDPAQVEQFANEMGLSFEYPMCYTIEGFRNLLENNGPLWVAASVPGLHAIVVTGYYHDGTNTYVRVTDPWDRAVGTPGAPGAYLNTHATGSRYILTWEDFVREYESAATDYSGVNLQILHAGGTDGRTPNYGKPAGYAQSLAAKLRAARAAGLPSRAATVRAQEEASAEKSGPTETAPETGAWNGVSWELDQFAGFQLPSGERADAAPAATASRSVSLDDWPFVPSGDTRTQLPLTVSWRHGGGAVGDVRIVAGAPEATPGASLQVAGRISRAPGGADSAALKVALRYHFAGSDRREIVALTELVMQGDGTYQRQDRWEQAQASAA